MGLAATPPPGIDLFPCCTYVQCKLGGSEIARHAEGWLADVHLLACNPHRRSFQRSRLGSQGMSGIAARTPQTSRLQSCPRAKR